MSPSNETPAWSDMLSAVAAVIILSKNRVGMNEDTPSAPDGKRHALQAEILKALQHEYCIIVSANQSRLMIPAPGNHFTGLAGPLVFGLTMAFLHLVFLPVVINQI